MTSFYALCLILSDWTSADVDDLFFYALHLILSDRTSADVDDLFFFCSSLDFEWKIYRTSAVVMTFYILLFQSVRSSASKFFQCDPSCEKFAHPWSILLFITVRYFLFTLSPSDKVVQTRRPSHFFGSG